MRRALPLERAIDWVAVTRPRKFAPFIVVLLNACLLSTSKVSWGNFCLSSLFIATSCSFGMRVNVWTDRELDQSSKPQLYGHLVRSSGLHRLGIAVESAISLICILALTYRDRFDLAIWLLLFGALFGLYSFNFLVPRRGKEYRLKIYWWGNLATAGGGYFALWMAGFSISPGHWHFATRLFLAILFASLEYTIFLCECATDAEEEKRSSLRTLPATLGRFRTVLLAWVSCLLLAAWWFGFTRPRVGGVFGTWYATSSVLACSGFLYFAKMTHSPRLWDIFVDTSFWIIRLGAFVILVFPHGG